MNEGCDKIKEALENLHIDDCDAFKTGNLWWQKYENFVRMCTCHIKKTISK